MTFSEVLTEARRLVKANSTSYPTSEITVSANRALDREVVLIRQADGRWQWDDSNQTDFPFATTSLVLDQQDYSLDATHYRIERVEVKDEEGNWHKLASIDQADIYDQSLTDFLKTSGQPQYYDKIGNSIMLYPKPEYSQVASLKVFYQRGPSYFTTSDTSKTPGFNPLFHRLIPLWCAYDYAFINDMKIAANLRSEISQAEEQLQEFYALRDKDEHITLTTKRGNFN
jgi:hypothetical protein